MSVKIEKFLEYEYELELKGNDKILERYLKLMKEMKIKKKKKKKKTPASVLKSGQLLMIKLIEPLIEAIKKNQEICSKPHRGRPKKYCVPLLSLPAEKLALITIRQALNACANVNTARITNVVNSIADMVKKEMDFDKLKKSAEKRIKVIKKLVKVKGPKVIPQIKKEYGLATPRWSPGTREHLGSALIKLLISSTKAFKKDTEYEDKKTISILKMTDSTWNSIKEQHIKFKELMSPFYRLMVCPPKPWKKLEEGGYIFIKTSVVKMLKKEHIKYLQKANLKNVYKALNLIQATPWRINRMIYKLMKYCWENNNLLGDLPPKDDLPIPIKPSDYQTNEESKKKWNREAKEAYEENAERRAKRYQLLMRLTIAMEYLKKPKIYSPHVLDFRGRVYPLPQFLNPQGDDTSKALLEFAEGKPLGENGWSWLAIHLANLFGVDKCSFKKRINWVKTNQYAIIDSAKKPLKGEKFWTKAEKPWSALAACFEWYGYCQKRENWVSHIPIIMDGTCNGLQHYSAMARDFEGGKATNLVDSENPRDIYTEVLNIVKKSVERDAEKAIPEAINWKDHLTRKIVKPSVMTTPYGVQERGRLEQLLEILREIKVPGSKWDNAKYLSKIIEQAIGFVVKSAPRYMRWLQDIAERLAKINRPVVWHTPAGFIVYQGYKHIKRREVKTVLQSLILKEEIDGFSVRRQKQGLPPNFVHSLDAAHMMKTIIAAYNKYGISSFAMIHDSYGVHACDWENFNYLIRREFAKIYSCDIVKKFNEEVQSEVKIKLPDPPPLGDLDIKEILKSRYFFD